MTRPYYPTIPRICIPASWSARKRAMYALLVNASKLTRTTPGFYARLGISFRMEADNA